MRSDAAGEETQKRTRVSQSDDVSPPPRPGGPVFVRVCHLLSRLCDVLIIISWPCFKLLAVPFNFTKYIFFLFYKSTN